MYRWAAYKLTLHYSLHLVLYAVLRCFQLIYWKLNGVSEHLRGANNGKNYQSSAQLLKVWYRAVPKIAVVHKRHHFITTHERFVHPDFALQRHVVLMTVTENEAIFGVPKPTEDLTETSKYPFLFASLFENAEYLLIMPKSSMIKLAENMKSHWHKVVWLHHPGRCGSTALFQAFNCLPNAAVLSESHADFSINYMYRRKNLINGRSWNESDEYKTEINAAVKLLTKKYLKDATILFIKTAPMNSPAIAKLLHQLFPEMRQFFMYRDAEPQITSLCRAILGQDFLFDSTRYLSQKFSLCQCLHLCQPVGLLYNITEDKAIASWLLQPEQIQQLSGFGEFAVGWAATCYDYKKVIESIDWQEKFQAFKYEDMQRNCRRFLEHISEYLDLSLTTKDRRNACQPGAR